MLSNFEPKRKICRDLNELNVRFGAEPQIFEDHLYVNNSFLRLLDAVKATFQNEDIVTILKSLQILQAFCEMSSPAG